MIRAATTKNGGKKLQINIKKIPDIKNLKFTLNSISSQQTGAYITTDDRRLLKYNSKNIIAQNPNELPNYEFTSARVMPSSKKDLLTIGRDNKNQELVAFNKEYHYSE